MQPTRGVVTPEAVLLEFESASVGSRVLAIIIDLSVQGTALFAFFLILGLATADRTLSAAIAISVVTIALFVVLLGYPVAMETLWRGRTLGKAAVGLRVVTTEGAPIRFRHAAVRSALGLVDLYLFLGLVAVLSVLFTRDNQRLGDLAAGTRVLRERSGTPPPVAVVFPPPPGYEQYAASLDAGPVTADEYELVRSFLLRVHQLSPPARHALAYRLANPLARKLGHQPPPNVVPEAFLVCLAAAYQRRHGELERGRGQPPASAAAPAPPGRAGGRRRLRPPDLMAYLDHAASTPMHPEAVEAMLPHLRNGYGNPSGAHTLARAARAALEDARDSLAETLGAEPGELVLTGSGTEADNLALLGAHARHGGAVVSTSVEHHAVLHPVERLGGRLAPVDHRGVVGSGQQRDGLVGRDPEVDHVGRVPGPVTDAEDRAGTEVGEQVHAVERRQAAAVIGEARRPRHTTRRDGRT